MNEKERIEKNIDLARLRRREAIYNGDCELYCFANQRFRYWNLKLHDLVYKRGEYA